MWETGAVNQSNAANTIRTVTALQRPSPPTVRPRTSPINLCGSNTPYMERTTIATESIASAIAIDLSPGWRTPSVQGLCKIRVFCLFFGCRYPMGEVGESCVSMRKKPVEASYPFRCKTKYEKYLRKQKFLLGCWWLGACLLVSGVLFLEICLLFVFCNWFLACLTTQIKVRFIPKF